MSQTLRLIAQFPGCNVLFALFSLGMVKIADVWFFKDFLRSLSVILSSYLILLIGLFLCSVFLDTKSFLSDIRKFREIVFCFTFFQLQLRETVGKPNWAVILRFPSRKRGVKSRGTLRDPAGVEMGYTPAWDPPFSTRKRKILAKLGFSTVLRNVTGKRWNRKLFLLFSGPE